MTDYRYYVFDDKLKDTVFDEKGNQFLALRKVQWDTKGTGKDESKAKLELRKWNIDNEGNERPNKGFSFLTEDGPHMLTDKLVEYGYGNTKTILNNIAKRDDFKAALKNEELPATEDDGEYFNPNEYLQNLISEVGGDDE